MNRLTLVLISLLALGACEKEPVSPTATLINNVRGYTTVNGELVTFSEIAFDGGAILATGNGELAQQFKGIRTIDGNQRTLLPGLIDAHGHISGLGRSREQIDLAGTASLDQALNRIQSFAAAHPEARWLLGRGWNQVLWSTPEFPNRGDLDALNIDRPIWLRRIDGHAAWGNSAALSSAGIDAGTQDPDGGRLLRNSDGEPTGVLVDLAMGLVEKEIPADTNADIERMIKVALNELAALGVTSVHDAGVSANEAGIMRSMAERGELPIRIYAMLSGAGGELDAFGEPLIDFADAMLSVRSVKLYADGALGSRGAALMDDYSDEPGNKGLLFADGQELGAAISKGNAAGFQVNTHAIGDLANRVVLDAIEKAQSGKPSEHRNRIEHSQVVALADIPRFNELGVIASMQPVHATSDMNMAEDRVGAERIKGAYAWRRMLDAGVVIAAGSDFPVELANPMHGLHAAINRTDHQGRPDGGWYPEEALTRSEALSVFTEHAAFAAHQETFLGRLSAGYKADFILVDDDFFEMPAADIWSLKVLETWVNGERVFAADEKTDP